MRKCTKPDCDCIKIGEQKNGGPVKSYPCLGELEFVEEQLNRRMPGIPSVEEPKQYDKAAGKLANEIMRSWLQENKILTTTTQRDRLLGKISIGICEFADEQISHQTATLREKLNTMTANAKTWKAMYETKNKQYEGALHREDKKEKELESVKKERDELAGKLETSEICKNLANTDLAKVHNMLEELKQERIKQDNSVMDLMIKQGNALISVGKNIDGIAKERDKLKKDNDELLDLLIKAQREVIRLYHHKHDDLTTEETLADLEKFFEGREKSKQ